MIILLILLHTIDLEQLGQPLISKVGVIYEGCVAYLALISQDLN